MERSAELLGGRFWHDTFEDQELGAAFPASGEVKKAGSRVVGECVAFDFDGKLAGRAESSSSGKDKNRALGYSQKRAGWLVETDLVDASSDGRARDFLSGTGVQSKDSVSNRNVEAVVTRAEDNASGLGGVEIKVGQRFEGRTQDKDTAAILQGQEELVTRWVIGKRGGTPFQVDS
jgi:hypothetical protein